MTEKLRAVEDALTAFIRERDDNDSLIVTAFYTVAHVVIPDEMDNGVSEYRYVHPDGQDAHVHLGLLAVANLDATGRPDE